MRIVKADNNDEKLVLTGMITDDVVCGRIVAKWQKDLFKSKYANLIAGWCHNYYLKYQTAPGNIIKDYFEQWCEKSKDEATVTIVERFLLGLNQEYTKEQGELNSNYIIDVAGKYFALVRIEKMKDQLEINLEAKDAAQAEDTINTYTPITMGIGAGIDVLQDKEAWRAAFMHNNDALINFPGALGAFFGDDLSRECFVSFEGPEGRGKSFWLMEVAFRAILQRRRVLFFELGDMSQDQILRRMGTRITKNPVQPCTIKYPTSLEVIDPSTEEGRPYAEVEYEERTFSKVLTWQMVWNACHKIRNCYIRSLTPYWRLISYPPDTLHCREIESIMTDYAREGWIADVVVVDYSDLLNMQYHNKEGRDTINETWKGLRKISIGHHCLVVTATQTDAASNEAWVIRRRNFSDDKRKRGHISAGYGINQTESEKEMQVMRLNKIKKRHGYYTESGCVWVVGCLDLANPAIRSVF